MSIMNSFIGCNPAIKLNTCISCSCSSFGSRDYRQQSGSGGGGYDRGGESLICAQTLIGGFITDCFSYLTICKEVVAEDRVTAAAGVDTEDMGEVDMEEGTEVVRTLVMLLGDQPVCACGINDKSILHSLIGAVKFKTLHVLHRNLNCFVVPIT